MRKRFKILIAMGVVLLVLAAVAYWRVQPRTFDDVRKENLLCVATEYSAQGFVVNGSDTSGFQYELLKAFADTLGVGVQFVVEPDLNKNIEGLNSGAYDLIMKLLPITTELKDEVSFSLPIAKNNLVLVQRKPTKTDPHTLVRDVAALDGKTIYLPSGSPDALVLRHIEEELGIALRIEYLPDIDTEHLLAMVARGKIRFVAADLSAAQAVKRFYPQLDSDTQLGFDQWRAWAFPAKEQELRNRFDSWFAAFKATDAYSQLLRKYHNFYKTGNL